MPTQWECFEENKDLYYAALRRTQGTFKAHKPNWEPWTLFFLRCLKKQKDNLAAKIEREKILAQSLPEHPYRYCVCCGSANG